MMYHHHHEHAPAHEETPLLLHSTRRRRQQQQQQYRQGGRRGSPSAAPVLVHDYDAEYHHRRDDDDEMNYYDDDNGKKPPLHHALCCSSPASSSPSAASRCCCCCCCPSNTSSSAAPSRLRRRRRRAGGCCCSWCFHPSSSRPQDCDNHNNPHSEYSPTRGEYDRDGYDDDDDDNNNNSPCRNCTFGTADHNGIWINHTDRVGTFMAVTVWLLVLYSIVTISLLAQQNHLPVTVAMLYATICALALASHIKTSLTDPGAIPDQAIPIITTAEGAGRRKASKFHSMCSVCQTYKPPAAHHCRICGRCVSRMDHHCPWMNNCIGVGNMKHFILFLIYIWSAAVLVLTVFALNYFFCVSESCEYTQPQIHLVRVLTFLAVGALLFTSSMLMNVMYGIVTGIGTIDRLKMKATDTWKEATEEPVPLTDIFGFAGVWTWWVPIDPVFYSEEIKDNVYDFTTRQRLLQQQYVYKYRQLQLLQQQLQQQQNHHHEEEEEREMTERILQTTSTTTTTTSHSPPIKSRYLPDGYQIPRCEV